MSRTLHASILFTLIAFGCGGPPLGESFEQPAPRPPPPPVKLVAGDTIEVEYLRAATAPEQYHLSIGDRLRIELQLHPELAASVVVAPDGTITYHRVGALHVNGKSVEEVRANLQKALAAHFPDPDVTVFLEQGDVQLDKFIDTLLKHPSGTLRDLQIERDGHVSLPAAGTVIVAGLTVAETEELLNRRIHEQMPSLQVSVRTKALTQEAFSILGEVARPGRYDLHGEPTLADAIAMAGGETLVADLEQIVVIGAPVNDQVQAWLYDLKTALQHGSALSQVRVQPQDTVLVLRTGLGDVNVWVDQWIRRNIPGTLNATYHLNNISTAPLD